MNMELLQFYYSYAVWHIGAIEVNPEFKHDAQFHRANLKQSGTDASKNLPLMPNYELAAVRKQ